MHLRTRHCSVSFHSLTYSRQGKTCHSHFRYRETEAQRNEVPCLRVTWFFSDRAGFEPRKTGSSIHALEYHLIHHMGKWIGSGDWLSIGVTGGHKVRAEGTSHHMALSVWIHSCLCSSWNAVLMSCCSKQWGTWLLEISAEQSSKNTSFCLSGFMYQYLAGLGEDRLGLPITWPS